MRALFGLLGLIVYLGCVPIEECKHHYVFNISTEITGEPDTIAIGDTVWFYSHYPIQMKDETSGELVDLAKFSFQPKLFFMKIDTSKSTSALPYAAFKPIYGAFNPAGTGFDCIEQIVGNEKRLKVGIICKHRGMYLISIGQGFADDLDIEIKDKKCYETVLAPYITNKSRENNYYLLKYSQDSELTTSMTQKYFQSSGSYIFVVH